MVLVHANWLLCTNFLGTKPGAPTPIEPGGTYAHSPSPQPPYPGKRISKDIPYTPYLGYGYHWQLQKTPPFPGFLEKSSHDVLITCINWDYSCNKQQTTKNTTPFPEKMGKRMRPPYDIRVGARGTKESKIWKTA